MHILKTNSPIYYFSLEEITNLLQRNLEKFDSLDEQQQFTKIPGLRELFSKYEILLDEIIAKGVFFSIYLSIRE